MWDFQPHLIQWTTWPTKAVLPQHMCVTNEPTNQPTSSTLCVTRSPRQFQAALLCRVVVSSAHVRYSTTEQSRSCNETLIYQRCTNGTLSNNHHLLTHNKKLSSRRETGQRFVSLSFEMTLLNKTCVFLLAFRWNYVCISYHFSDIQHQIMIWPWNWGHGSFKIAKHGAIRFLLYVSLPL